MLKVDLLLPLEKQMQRPKITTPCGPEAKIQAEIIKFLTLKEWYVKETHGNLYQFGFPDLFACHYSYGSRWIEVKNPECYSFTPAQLEAFPMFTAKRCGVWILGSATENEYKKLFEPANWWTYLLMLNGRTANHLTGPQVGSQNHKTRRI